MINNDYHININNDDISEELQDEFNENANIWSNIIDKYINETYFIKEQIELDKIRYHFCQEIDDLQRVLKISRQEEEENDIMQQVLKISKQEEEKTKR